MGSTSRVVSPLARARGAEHAQGRLLSRRAFVRSGLGGAGGRRESRRFGGSTARRADVETAPPFVHILKVRCC